MSKHQPEEVRRRQILDAAKRCFIQRGLDATTIRHIAEAAELSLGGIYFHYQSKDEIFRAICSETYGTVLSRWRSGDSPDDADSAEARIRAIAESNLRLLEDDPDHFRLALVLNGAAVVDPKLKAVKREQHLGFVGYLAGVLERGVDRHELVPHDTSAVAEGLVAIFDGLYLRCAIDADVHPRRSALTAIDLLVSALRRH